LKEIATAKVEYDRREAQELWNICTAVVKECLEFRKVELKLGGYRKPTDEVLLKIFMKIFPEFKAEDIFGSVNWKN
jgi:hypothetical protein